MRAFLKVVRGRPKDICPRQGARSCPLMGASVALYPRRASETLSDPPAARSRVRKARGEGSSPRGERRPAQDVPERIAAGIQLVYEVYVKEETAGSDGRSEVSTASSLSASNDAQSIQADCMDLDTAMDSEVINADGTVTKLLGKEALKYKILEQSVGGVDENLVVYTHPVAEAPPSSSTRLIDKDDPRSRLHFVKYLKREGKTLKIWECGICSKEFRHQYTLMRHLPTHTDERNFKCEACGKAFRQLSTLSQHKAIHSDARPYVCEFCKKTFNRVSTLISHRKTHSEHKPHKCHLCGKGFHQKGNLRNHVFTHTNERPYKCELCGKGFNQMSNLVCHKVKAHAHSEKMHIVIDEIETKAMELALLEGQTPFALFKSAKGAPVLVKVSPTGNRKHILTPATAEDLRMAGKMSVNSPMTTDTDGSKALQIKVPVVATVIQNVEPDGKISFAIESPGTENDQENLVTAFDSQFTYAELTRNELDRQSEPAPSSEMEDCNELLELAAQGGIQFVRATEDGRYEVMTNSEARDLMAQNSHDVTILDGEEAEAINVVNIRGNGEVIIGDSDNQIMVLDSAPVQKSMSMDSIEILEDKDIRILESKNLDDRFEDGITFLSPSKIDDLILGPKSLSMDAGVGEQLDEGIDVSSSQQDLSSILSHRSEVSALSGASQSAMSSLLIKNHPPLSILNDALPYLKNNQSLAEDLSILNSPMGDHHSEYDTKIKLSSVFDDAESDSGLISIGKSDLKLLRSIDHGMKLFDGKPCLPPSKIFPNLGEIKILGPKNSGQELVSPHYQEAKMLDSYEQFLSNASSSANSCGGGAANTSRACRKEVKILGKKLGTGIITSTEDGSIVRVVDDNSKMVMGASTHLCGSAIGTMISPPRLDVPSAGNGGSDSFLPQASSPCGSDFLNFENRLPGKDSSPSSHYEASQKDSFGSGGLPDLD
ncbi:hypothetical protein KM043_008495 [Ampulex compressa]|nr:hypothetical protein KM043_008495 [Ampulex compressa]